MVADVDGHPPSPFSLTASEGDAYHPGQFISAAGMLQPGSKVGPYEVVAPLGAGGMGEVYVGRDPRLERCVALKTLPDALACSPGRVARLHTEARALAALSHPGIASLFGLEETADGRPVLVMELVEGPSLADRLAGGALPVPQALAAAIEIARAMEAAHAKGILHRDLKPSNVRFTTSGQVKLLDFGLAKLLVDAGEAHDSDAPTDTTDGTGTAAVLGTGPYMSPEQARGEPLDRRTDVWSFGCVLFEMLTGARAFAGRTRADALAAILGKTSRLERPAFRDASGAAFAPGLLPGEGPRAAPPRHRRRPAAGRGGPACRSGGCRTPAVGGGRRPSHGRRPASPCSPSGPGSTDGWRRRFRLRPSPIAR